MTATKGPKNRSVTEVRNFVIQLIILLLVQHRLYGKCINVLCQLLWEEDATVTCLLASEFSRSSTAVGMLMLPALAIYGMHEFVGMKWLWKKLHSYK
jgi:hypothetical protein